MEKTQDRSAFSELQEPGGVLEELAHKGARQLLAQAMETHQATFCGLQASAGACINVD